MYTIYIKNGRYYGDVQTQDGHEMEDFATLDEAVRWVILSARVYNFDYIRSDHVRIVEASPDIRPAKDSKLPSVVEKYKVSVAEAETLVAIREGRASVVWLR